VDKWVEIGFWTLPITQKKNQKQAKEEKLEQAIIFYVQDGIGFEKILGYHFSHFQAHASNKYGGGTVLG